MACGYNIRSKLFKGNSPGGTLIYMGYSNVAGGPFGSGGSTVPPSTGDTTIPYPAENLIDVTGFIAGYYKFKYEGTDCDGNPISEEAILQVVDRASAGDPNTVVFCVNDTGTINLNDQISNETTGGEWSVNPSSEDTEAEAALSGNSLDLSAFTTPGTYFLDYSTDLIGAEPGYEETQCSDCYDKVTLTVIITAASDAGTAQDISTCAGCGNVNLFDYLSLADPNGSWTQLSGPGTNISGGYLGTINPTAGTRVFRYTVGSGNCADSEDIEVVTHNEPYAGADGTLTICSDNGGVINLNDHITGEDANGYWELVGSGPQNGDLDLLNGTYTPEIGDDVVLDLRYNVVVPGTISECSNACEDQSQLLLTVHDSGYAGENASDNGCISDGFDINQIIQDASPDPITTGEMWFLGYSSNCDTNYVSGTFNANAQGSQTHTPMTNFGPDLFVTGLSGSGCYVFMHYTPNQGAPCEDFAMVTIEIGACCGVTFDINEISGELCIGNLQNCNDPNPTGQWYYSANGTNFSPIAGATGACHTPTQGDGVYALEITCDTCVETEYYPWYSGCSVSVSISGPSGGILTANPTGCSGTVSYQWSYSTDGITNWINLGNSQTQALTHGDGTYKVVATCPDGQGCQGVDTYDHDTGCNVSAGTITENNGVLTANPTGGTQPYSYQWQYSSTGNPGSYTDIPGATSQSYTPTQSGHFQVIVTDANGCTDKADITYSVPSCNTTVTLSEINGGTQLEATIGGTANPVIRWQYSPSGTGWTALPQFDDQAIITPDQGSGHYRVIVYDGTLGNCPAEATIEWDAPCSGNVVISESTCGNNTIDLIFLIDESVSVDSSEWASMKSNIDATIDSLFALNTVDARFAVVQWSGPGQQNLAVPFTADPATAKNFSRTFSGNTDMSEATAWLYGELQASNISFRGGAAKHLVFLTDGNETGNSCSSSNGNFRKCVGGTLVYDDYDQMQSTYNTIHSVVRYQNGFQNQDEPSNAVCAKIASVGGNWNGDVDIPNDPGALRPRRMYDLTFGDPVPDLPFDITCTELDSVVNGCSGTVVYEWQYRTGPGQNWSPIPGGGSSTIEVNEPGEYRLKVDCGTCTYFSDPIIIT